MIPLAVPNLAGNEAKYLQECIETTFVSSVGPFVDRFEEMVADAAGCEHAVATSSGTAALHVALHALGVGPGDRVLMPAYTFIATANAVRMTGATPVFLDVAGGSWTLDPAAISTWIEENGAPAAILPVHTFGHPADMPAIVDIATAVGCPVLGDAAAALGATCHGTAATTFGTLSAISFNGNKTITCGGGGAVVANDPALAERVRHLTTTGRVSSRYDHDVAAFNYRMTNLEAAVGCAQMERFDDLLAAKRRIADAYDRAFADIAGVAPFPRADSAESACWYAGFIVTDAAALSTDEVIDGLNARDIAGRHFWKPMHLQAPYAEAPHGSLPVTNEMWQRVVTLPCSTGLTDDEQGQVISAVRELFDA